MARRIVPGHSVATLIADLLDSTEIGALVRGLGWQGYHLQPDVSFARALERGDGREGGVLCICRPQDEKSLRAQLQGGYELRHWNNGTPS